MNEVDRMRQEDYSKDWVMHNGKSDLWFWERKMRVVDERWWRTSVARRLNRDQVMDISRLSSGKSCMSERESYNRCVRWLLASGDLRIGVEWENLDFNTCTSKRVLDVLIVEAWIALYFQILNSNSCNFKYTNCPAVSRRLKWHNAGWYDKITSSLNI